MKYSVISLFFLLFSAHCLMAQHMDLEDSQYRGKIQVRLNENFEGSPFYNENWRKGYVIFNTGNKSNTTDLKFSSFTNELLFKKGDKILAVTPNTFSGFVLYSRNGNIVFKKGFNSKAYDISPNLFLEVFHDGSIQLLTQYKNRIVVHRSNPLTGKVTKEYSKQAKYFLVDENKTFHEIDLSKDDILGSLSKYQSKLEAYAEKNDFNFDEKTDLKLILQRYEKLVKRNN